MEKEQRPDVRQMLMGTLTHLSNKKDACLEMPGLIPPAKGRGEGGGWIHGDTLSVTRGRETSWLTPGEGVVGGRHALSDPRGGGRHVFATGWCCVSSVLGWYTLSVCVEVALSP